MAGTSHYIDLGDEIPSDAHAWPDRDSLSAVVKAEKQVVVVRWLGILCAAPLAPFLFHGLERDLLLTVCTAAALYNLAFEKFVIPHRPKWLMLGHIVTIGDTVLSSSVIYFTGGLQSEFYLVYFLIAVVSAIRFGRRRAIFSVGVAALAYCAVIYATGAPRTLSTLADICLRLGFTAVTAVFVGFVVDRAVAAEAHIDRAAEAARQALSQATAALTNSLMLDEVMSTVARWATRLAGAVSAQVETRPPSGLREWLWRKEDRAARTAEFEQESEAGGDEPREFDIVYGTESIGTVRLQLPRGAAFDAMREGLVNSFLRRCGSALANAWTFAAVESQALVDPTTGLANHRRFKDYLSDRARESMERGRPLSVIMVDLDMFKEFNDAFGHLAGDRALRRVGHVLRESAGEGALAARYGGDEFVAVLPEVAGPDAAAIARNVLDQFRAAVDAGVDGLAPPVGISVGCATLGPGDPDYQTVVGRADLAMYVAKRSGGGVRVFDDLEEGDPLRSLVGSMMSQLTRVSKADMSAMTRRRPRGRDRATSRHSGPAHTAEVIQALVTALRRKDPALYVHSRNVARLSFRIARRLGLSAWDTHDVGIAGLLHDIGKICVPDKVQLKEGALYGDEVTAIRMHPVQGAEILAPVPSLRSVALAVRHHHESFDGTGYPDGLSGDQIPLASRIVLVADAYDAITSDRPYRARRSPQEAVRILRENQGRQFDPAVVATLTTLLGDLNGAPVRRARHVEVLVP